MAKLRRSGSRKVGRGFFALLWIALGGVSGLYLFSLWNDPAAFGQIARLNPAAAGEPTGSVDSAGKDASALMDAARDEDIAQIKNSLSALTQQVATFDARLKPIEKIMGPVVALPPAASVTTSPPPPRAAPAPVAAEAKPVPQATVAALAPAAEEIAPPPPPAPAPKPVAEPAVQMEPAVTETDASQDDTPPPAPPVTADDAAAESAPGDAAAAAAAEEAAPPPAEVETAKLDPTKLPPTANDGSTRFGIEIGSVAKQDGLRPLWREFLTDHAALVAGLQPRRVLAPDKTWRLIAGPFSSAAEAEQACALFKKASRSCAATVFAGDAL
jgi:hypothetical protein